MKELDLGYDTVGTFTRQPITVTANLGYISGAETVKEVISQVFGKLVELALPVIKHYHGDLFFDARWLDENLTGTEFCFWYSVRSSGTGIGLSEDFVKAHGGTMYRVIVRLVGGVFTMVMETA